MKVYKEEKKRKCKKICVAKYEKQRRHQSHRFLRLAANAQEKQMMALRAGYVMTNGVFPDKHKDNCITYWTQSHSSYVIYGTH
jgi:hypothetical protein